MKILVSLGIILIATWLCEILFLIAAFYDAYMDDVRKHGKEQARKIWKPHRKK